MYKLFSIDQANSLIPDADRKISELSTAATELRDVTRKLKQAQPFSMEARDLYMESVFLAQQVNALKESLSAMGLQLVDPQTGKLGFPGQIGAELVYLSWEPGEDHVSHFHRLAGSDTRPIPLNPGVSPRAEAATA